MLFKTVTTLKLNDQKENICKNKFYGHKISLLSKTRGLCPTFIL